MMNISKITIITLTYKNWRLLDKAIKSVVNQVVDQKYKIEYLIVDDGTVDFDASYVSSLLVNSNLNYRIIVNKINVGTVASFNNAIRQSTGDIIMPLSADDVFYDSNVVNDIVNEFSMTDAKIITGYKVLMSDALELDCFPKEKVINLFSNRKKLLKYVLCRGNIISGASTYYLKSVFNDIGFFDEHYRLLEDYPFYIKALSNGIDINFYRRKVICFGDKGVSSVGKVNQILGNDYKILLSRIINNSNLSFFEKRFVIYSRMKSEKQRYLHSWLYPEQFTYFVIFKLARFVSDYIKLNIKKEMVDE